MTESIASAEIVDEGISILEESPMLGAESELVIVKTAISVCLCRQARARILPFQAGLLKIFRAKSGQRWRLH